jgi:amidase
MDARRARTTSDRRAVAAARARKVSPVELTEAMLRRIERLDPALKSYACVTPELALAQARRAEQMIGRRQILSQLHGVPIAVKDLCQTEGVVTAAGHAVAPRFRADLRCDGGAQAARGRRGAARQAAADRRRVRRSPPGHPAPLNPFHRDHWSGASSSGSGVATAAGLCFGSLGTDTGGSIRFPSAANGNTG